LNITAPLEDAPRLVKAEEHGNSAKGGGRTRRFDCCIAAYAAGENSAGIGRHCAWAERVRTHVARAVPPAVAARQIHRKNCINRDLPACVSSRL